MIFGTSSLLSISQLPIVSIELTCLLSFSYVGTLHEINPEASTIALENVVSFGTEGRRGNPAEDIPPSASVYEYIVFRGSDVKDISVAEEKKENAQPEPPQVLDDPAILGVSAYCFFYFLPIALSSVCMHVCHGRTVDHRMKYFGCKLTDLFRIAQTIHVDISVAFLLIRSKKHVLVLSCNVRWFPISC